MLWKSAFGPRLPKWCRGKSTAIWGTPVAVVLTHSERQLVTQTDLRLTSGKVLSVTLVCGSMQNPNRGEVAMAALETFAIYVTPFLILGLVAKLMLQRYVVDLTDVQE